MGIFKGLSDRKQHRTYVKEGEKRDSSGDFGGAVESYTKALEMKIYKDKPDYMVHYKRGCTYEKMGAIEKAVDDFKIFLSADARQLKASSFVGAVDSFTIGWQRATAQICLTNYTFEKLLRTYDFDVGYSNEKFYDWGHKFKKVRDTLKENPQETTYRMGVARLLQEKHKEAIQHLDEAIKMNSEDARSYLFRGIAHAFESRKGGLFGPSRSAKELSKSKAISDFERAIALSKDDALIEQADKWKKNVTGK